MAIHPPEQDVKLADLMAQLSPRQQEILGLIAAGLSNREIGARLSLTTGTVKQHLNGIFSKIGVANRTSAAALWRDSQALEVEKDGEEPSSIGLSSLEIAPTPGRPLAIAIIGLVLTGNMAIAPSEPYYRSFIATAEASALAWGGDLQWTPAGIGICTFGIGSVWLDVYERAESFAQDLLTRTEAQLGSVGRVALGYGIEPQLIAGERLIVSHLARRTLEKWLSADAPGCVAISLDMEQTTGPDLSDLLISAPFIHEAKMALRAGRGIWLSVEAWPPRYAKALLDAMAEAPPSDSWRTIRLRLPTHITDETTLHLAAQVASQVGNGTGEPDSSKNLSAWLEDLAKQGPVQVLAYGLHSLDAVRSLIDPHLMVELDRLPILIVLMSLPMPGAPRLAVRLLSSRGERPIIGRLHTVQLSDRAASNSLNELMAIIDQVDSVARKLLDIVADHGTVGSAFLAERLHLPPPRVEHYIRGLVATGLILWEQDSIRMRDQQTLSTLKALISVK